MLPPGVNGLPHVVRLVVMLPQLTRVLQLSVRGREMTTFITGKHGYSMIFITMVIINLERIFCW